MTAREVIDLLGLRPLPREGGHYRETYRCGQLLPGSSGKALGTAIYYLLTPDTCSALHRLPSDEVYHFYLGGPVEVLLLPPEGAGRTVVLGNDLAAGQCPQFVVPAGVWQGSRLLEGEFALMGTTMAPGFDFSDYEPGRRGPLAACHPEFAALIERLTPDG